MTSPSVMIRVLAALLCLDMTSHRCADGQVFESSVTYRSVLIIIGIMRERLAPCLCCRTLKPDPEIHPPLQTHVTGLRTSHWLGRSHDAGRKHGTRKCVSCSSPVKRKKRKKEKCPHVSRSAAVRCVYLQRPGGDRLNGEWTINGGARGRVSTARLGSARFVPAGI